MLLVPHITGYPTGFCPPMVAIVPQSLSRIRPLVWPAALKKEVQVTCTCLARAMCTIGQRFIWRLNNLSSCANVPSLVLLAQKFTNSEDLTFKKLNPSGACRLCRSSLGTLPPPRFCPPLVAIGLLSLGRIRLLVWPAASSKYFFRGAHAPALGTCYVASIAPRLVPSFFRGSGESNGTSTVTIRPPVKLQVPKCLETQTHSQTQLSQLFQRPTRGNL